jgi:hypothetical protein
MKLYFIYLLVKVFVGPHFWLTKHYSNRVRKVGVLQYTRITENLQRGTSLPDDMEQAHIKKGIAFIYHWYSFLF